jgi:hypothetical protein
MCPKKSGHQILDKNGSRPDPHTPVHYGLLPASQEAAESRRNKRPIWSVMGGCIAPL